MQPFHWYAPLARLTVLRVFCLTFLVTGAGTTLIALMEGTFRGSDPDLRYWIGPFFVWPVAGYVLMPVIMSLIFATYCNMDRTINAAVREDIIRTADERAELPIAWLGRSKAKLLLLFLLAAGVTAYARYKWMTGFTGLRTWELTASGHPSLLFYYSAVIVFAALFIVANAAVDFLLWVAMIYRLCRPDAVVTLQPNPFHPDGSAGLARFGRTALISYFVVFMLAVFIAVQLAEKFHMYPQVCAIRDAASLRDNAWRCFAEITPLFPAVAMSLIAVTVALPFVFFAQLWPLRSKIVACKQRITEHAWEDAMEKLTAARKAQRFDGALPHYNYLVDTVRIYDFVRGVSDWPFGRKAIAAVVLTALPALASAVRQLAALISP